MLQGTGITDDNLSGIRGSNAKKSFEKKCIDVIESFLELRQQDEKER
jgi:hypothetical protein